MRLPPHPAWTACSSARPTCRLPWATPATQGTLTCRPPSTTASPASCVRARRQAFWPPPNPRRASGWRRAHCLWPWAWTPCCWPVLRRICWRAFAPTLGAHQRALRATEAHKTPHTDPPRHSPEDKGTTTMKVCIYGAGAIGGWLGVALAQAGHPVSMVARGDTLRALPAEGLRMRRADGSLAQVPVTAHSDPAALGVQDLVVVAVKAPGLPDVARAMAPLIGPDTIVLTAMNGVPWWFLDGFGGAAQGRALESVDAGGVIAQAIPEI